MTERPEGPRVLRYEDEEGSWMLICSADSQTAARVLMLFCATPPPSKRPTPVELLELEDEPETGMDDALRCVQMMQMTGRQTIEDHQQRMAHR